MVVLVLTVVAVPLLVFIFLLAAVLILRVLRVLFALLPLLFLGLLLFALVGLILLGFVLRRLILSVLRLPVRVIAPVFMVVAVASSSTAVTPFLIAAVLDGLVFLLVFFHKLFQLEKELLCILQNLLFQLLYIFIAKACHIVGNVLHVFRFVGKHPSKGYGGEVRTVRFRQNAVGRYALNALHHLFRIFESRRAAKGKAQPKL